MIEYVCSTATRTIERPRLTPLQRGARIKAVAPRLPDSVLQQIRNHVRQCARVNRPTAGLIEDLQAMIRRPVIRIWVLTDGDDGCEDRWAATASVFVRTALKTASILTGRYVQQLLPIIVRVVKSVAGVIRLDQDNEFRLALFGAGQMGLRMSLFAPLGLFFLESVARAQVAWDVLVAPERRPRGTRTFGWAPLIDGLHSTLRFLLLEQRGRRFRPNALLYSPFGRHLMHLGAAQRVQVIKRLCTDCRTATWLEQCPNCGGNVVETSRAWLLSRAYLDRHVPQIGTGGRRGIVIDKPFRPVAVCPLSDVMLDHRTGRSTVGPEQAYHGKQVRQAARRAVGRMLEYLAAGSGAGIKNLVLWADAAGLEDPAVLLATDGLQDETLDKLAGALLSERIEDRATRVGRLNDVLPIMAASVGAPPCTPFNGTQVGTYLTRLRQRYMTGLHELLESTGGLL